AADARHHAGRDPLRVVRVGGAEPQLVHHGHRARAHRHDVADDPAHAGRGTLVRLDVRGAVVRLRLEGHGPAVADVHHPGVLAYAGEHARPHLRRGGLTEVAQVHL